jgi:hypothetical protein
MEELSIEVLREIEIHMQALRGEGTVVLMLVRL